MPHARLVTGGVVAASLAALALGIAPTSAATPRSHVHSRDLTVAVSSAGFILPERVQAGWVTFTATTHDADGHQLEGFRTKGGATAAQVVDDITRAVSFDQATSVAGTADTRRDAELVGGPGVDPVTPVSTTVALSAGTYYFFDFNEFFVPGQRVTLHRMDVVGPFRGAAPHESATVVETMVNAQPRFQVSGDLTASGPVAVRNEGDELHEMLLQRVLPGTTDAQVQAYYQSGSTEPPSYAVEAPLRGVAAMDPGRVAYVRLPDLPTGRYALLCFVPDDATGLPHVVEGMHAVVRMGR